MSLGNKFIKNSLSNVGGWVFLVFLSIATIPYIVHKLGYEAYGILSLVLMVLGYFAFLDFGLGEAVIKYFSHYYTLKDYKKMNSILNSILVLFIVIGVIGAVGIWLFTVTFAVTLFKIPLSLQSEARFCFFLSSFGFVLNLVFGVISKIPEAVQRFDVSNWNNVVIGTIVSVGNVVLLMVGFGLKEVVMLNLFGEILGIFIFYRASKALIPELRIGIAFSFDDLKEVFSFGVMTLMTKFSTVIIQSASQFVIAIIAGPAGVTIYNVPFKIISRFGAFVNRLSYTIFPLSSELHAKEDRKRLQDVYVRLSKYSFLIASIFFIPLAGFSKEILTFWMGPDFAAKGHLVMFFCCLAYYFFTLTTITGLVAMGVGNPRINTVFSFITAFINLATIYPLTKIWGVNGAAFSLLLSSIQAPVAIMWNNKRVIGVDPWWFFVTVYGKMWLIYLIFLAVIKCGAPYMGVNIWLFCLCFTFTYALLIAFSWQWGLSVEDKTDFKTRFAGLRTKFSVAST